MEDLDRAWQYLRTITESENHFNDLVFRIRALSSTWLLASFAGIGFVLTKELEIEIAKPILTLAISVLGAFGLFLLWMLDLLVYQNLLSANFDEGIKIEEEYSDLPQVRHRMREYQFKGSVRTRTVWFHIGMMSGALTPGFVICFLWLFNYQLFLSSLLLIIYLAVVIGIGGYMYFSSIRQLDK